MHNKQDQDRTARKSVVKRPEQQELEISQLINGPEKLLSDSSSDESLDKLALKRQLLGSATPMWQDCVSDLMARYSPKFRREWFYKLAELAGVDVHLMDVYVKPEFVRRFIIAFVYARFPRSVLRSLRGRNRKKHGKLSQHLSQEASDNLDLIIEQVYIVMKQSQDLLDFKMKYSALYKVYFQQNIFD